MCKDEQPKVVHDAEAGEPTDYDALLDARMAALGDEMRPRADLILQIKEDLKGKRGHERFELEKVILKMERQFVDDFNRDDAFERFQWPDGLVVEFVAPSIVTSKEGEDADLKEVHRLQGQNRVVAPAPPSADNDVENLQLVRGRRPLFSWLRR